MQAACDLTRPAHWWLCLHVHVYEMGLHVGDLVYRTGHFQVIHYCFHAGEVKKLH